MGIARRYFEWLREVRHFRWIYNSRHINVENGQHATEHIRAMGEEFSRGLPRDAENLKAMLPSELHEIREAYETKSVDFVERFRQRTAPLLKELDVTCEKGLTNMTLLRIDQFSYLKTLGFMNRWKPAVWILFILTITGLTLLDIAPSLLIFEGLMENDSVTIGRLIGSSDETMRDLILLLATVGFLTGVVGTAHVVAKVIGSSYLDGEVPAFGIAFALFVAILFVVVAGLRYGHEVSTQEDSYASYTKDFEKKKALGMATTDKVLTIDQWRPGYLTRAGFHASMFVLISLMIFLIAIYVSLWKMYGDLRLLTRRFKHFRYRVTAAKLSAQLRSEDYDLTNRWQKLRQSAQVEAQQFLVGVRKGMDLKDPPYDYQTRMQMQQAIDHISNLFGKVVRLPAAFTQTEKASIPANEEEWGMRYGTFCAEAALFDAFSKGAVDAFYHGERNPNSIVDAVSDHSAPGTDKRLMPVVTKTEMEIQYTAGFVEGSQVPYGKAWELAKNSGRAPVAPQAPQ